MLKSFYVKNYRNFQQGVKIDFSDTGNYAFSQDCLTNGLIGKMLIYGRNASGKTNLGSALMDACYILEGWSFPDEMDTYINADSEHEAVEFSYVLQFGQREVAYRYTKETPDKLRTEEMKIDHELFFQVDFSTGKLELNPGTVEINVPLLESYIFEQKQSQNENDDERGRKSKAQIPLFRWLCKNVIIPVNSPIIQAFQFLTDMGVYRIQNTLIRPLVNRNTSWRSILSDIKSLKSFEAFLNEMGVSCSLTAEQLPDGQ